MRNFTLYTLLIIFGFSLDVVAGNIVCPQISSSTQHFCLEDQPVVADLLPQDAVWYSSSTSTTPLSGSTHLVSSQFYYADNIDGTCLSRPRVRAYVYDDPDAGDDNVDAICDSEVSDLFPALVSIENYYLNLLSPGIPRTGTFYPSAKQMSADYNSEPIVGYKDFPRTYIYGAEGCQDSAVITVRIYEDVQAGTDTEVTFVNTGNPVNLFDYMEGDPSIGGTWSPQDGSFDPAQDNPGTFTYTVSNDLCGEKSANITVKVVTSLCPTTNSTYQEICEAKEGDFPKIKHLQAQDQGNGIAWYVDNTTGAALEDEAYLEDGQTYYLGADDGGCAGSRTEVKVSLARAPNAGRTTFINLSSDSDPVDLRDLINTTYLRPEPDEGGTMVPELSSGTTLFNPSLDADFTARKQFRHWIYSTNDICEDDYTVVYITIDPAANTSHRLYYLGINEKDSQKYLEYYPPGSPDEGIKANIWLDQPLEMDSVYKITVNGREGYYYVNNVYADPDTTPDMTLTADTEIILAESFNDITPIDPDEGEENFPNPEYGNYTGPVLSDENYVYTRMPQVGVINMDNINKTNEIIEQVTYFDGLGREKQSIAIGGGGGQQDIISPVEYDAFGRQAREYLPYAKGSLRGGMHPDALIEIVSFYNAEKFENTANPYSEKKFDNSPLYRVELQAAPGADWALGSGHEIGFGYNTNGSGEVRMFSVSFTGGNTQQPYLELRQEEFYPEAELYKFITYDEQHSGSSKNHSTEEFKDKQGRVVLKRTYADTPNQAEAAHDTYYVYDDYGNLTFVLPPKMEGSTNSLGGLEADLPKLGYQYAYDHRNRVVEKQIPGKGREYIVYNKLDQPVLIQDANQRIKGEWLYNKFDAFGRLTTTGTFSNSSESTRETIQAELDAHYSGSNPPELYEEWNGTSYTNRSYPTQNIDPLTFNYYDTYDFTGSILPLENTYGIAVSDKAMGLQTGSKIKVLETSDWITRITGYDDKAREVWTKNQNDYLETIDVIETKPDFVGKVKRQIVTHTRGQEEVVVEDNYTYDHMGRELSHTQSINGGDEDLIAHNIYDELGQLEAKAVGGKIMQDLATDSPTTFSDIIGINVESQGNIIKTTGVNTWGDAGLATENSISADGYIEGVVTSVTERIMFGLSSGNTDAHYQSIDYAIYARDDGKILVYENGTSRGEVGTYQPGDTLGVERVGRTIYYRKNGAAQYASLTDHTGSLIGDLAIYTSGGTLAGLELKTHQQGYYQPLQEITYAYNIRGWLKKINEPENLGEILFGFEINYNDPKNGTTTALFNGNISETHWKSQSSNNSNNLVSKEYSYSYDALNRITKAVDNTKNYNLGSVTYDKMGNILSLQRQGQTNADATLFGNMDDLTYSYDEGNRLMRVSDLGNSTEGFIDDEQGVGVVDAIDDYSYDVNGNLTSDANKGIGTTTIPGIKYNHLNLPTEVMFNNSTNQVIKYIYDATGVKLRKVVGTTATDYAGNFIYQGGNLEFFSHPEGYVEPDGSGGFDYVYQYKDHLGSVRLSYSDLNNNGNIDPSSEILDEKNYYPFGLEHEGYNTNIVDENNFKTYQDKEIEKEFDKNTIAFGWRDYDPAIGRFGKIDRFSEKYYDQSPYNFTKNNPILYAEVKGDSIRVSFRTGFLGIFGKKVTLTYDSENQQWNGADGKQYTGETSKFADRVLGDLKKNQENVLGNEIVSNLANDSFDHFVKKGSPNNNTYRSGKKNRLVPKDLNIYYNGSSSTSQKIFQGGKSGTTPGYIVLGHEMAHKYTLKRTANEVWFGSGTDERGVDEYNAIYYENVLRSANGLPLRTHYTENNGSYQGQILNSSGALQPPPTALSTQSSPTMPAVHVVLILNQFLNRF